MKGLSNILGNGDSVSLNKEKGTLSRLYEAKSGYSSRFRNNVQSYDSFLMGGPTVPAFCCAAEAGLAVYAALTGEPVGAAISTFVSIICGGIAFSNSKRY